MILVKKLKFFHLLCLSKTDREKVVPDVLDRNEAFKTIRLSVDKKKRKICLFAKGLIHRFHPKFEIS